MHLSSEDAASAAFVLGVLEDRIRQLSPTSRLTHLWRDWADLLAPAATGSTDRALDVALDLVTPGGLLPSAE